ncbi:hypothetical protein BS756_00765 [Staphylococcus sp. MB371]|nr:hypothetical protein BS756_00765 [Staphylococcus sp. MB371]
MHSPIVYLVEIASENYKPLEGKLPDDKQVTDDELLDFIYESDWLVANTLKEEFWHRGDWDLSVEEIFKSPDYYNLLSIDKSTIISIDANNLIKWDERFLELNEKYNQTIRKNLKANIFTDRIPFDDHSDYFEYQEMTGRDLGGIRFGIYSTYQDEFEFFDCVNTKYLIEYVKDSLSFQNKKEIRFELITNAVGDYHF